MAFYGVAGTVFDGNGAQHAFEGSKAISHRQQRRFVRFHDQRVVYFSCIFRLKDLPGVPPLFDEALQDGAKPTRLLL
jgi:hypothetical protein